jgi:hypothetical protein
MSEHVTLEVSEQRKQVAFEQVGTAAPVAVPEKQDQKQNALLYAYMQILDSVHVSLLSSQTNAMELNACEANMSLQNNQENSINYAAVNQNGFVQQNGNWEIIVIDGQVQGAQTAGGATLKASQLPGSILGYAGVQLLADQNMAFGQNVQVYGVNGIYKKATVQDYDKMQEVDEAVQKERDYFANKIIVLQQAGQVQQTNIGSKNDFMSQFIQEDTNIATILSTLSNELAQMLRTP